MRVRFWKKRAEPRSGLSLFQKHLLYIGRLAVLFYLLILMGTYLFLNALMFHPPPLRSSEPFKRQLIELPSNDGNQISALHLKAAGNAKTLLYSHGNGEDIWDRSSMLSLYQENGYSVLAYDYPGYGLSSGRPSERSVYAAAEAAWLYLTQEAGVAPEDIILYGRSIGSGPSCYLAWKYPAGGLVIESGFTSVTRVVTRIKLLPFDAFPNIRRISKVRCPVLFFHGERDEVVPFSHGRKLYKRAREPKRHCWVPGADHAHVVEWAGERYWETLKDFTESLQPSPQTENENPN